MEETLGKRIVFHRKRLGLTQDALAERMGVTAQAVSKWENDQSCPDIGALPKLAEIFGISTDELLGVERKEVTPPRSSRRTRRKTAYISIRTGAWSCPGTAERKAASALPSGFCWWAALCWRPIF